ncbi:hypothetical protein FOA52_007451 [Chlamydomonas sp. UWO 241]|nr:hypothetical protein FOA52_007451 [Chlamydomonas sp. UWO 241]
MSMARHRVVVPLLGLLLLAACSTASHHEPPPPPPRFQGAPADTVSVGQSLHVSLVEASRKEGILATVMGADCYSQALRSLRADCRGLNDDQRAMLSLRMLNCFLADTAPDKMVPCGRRESVRACTARLDSETFAAYTVFFTNLHALCVFVQNQDFERQAEALVVRMHAAALSAERELGDIAAGLGAQAAQLSAMDGALARLALGQAGLAEGVAAGSAQVADLAERTSRLQGSMNESLAAAMKLEELQATMSSELAAAAEEGRAAARDAAGRWDALQEQAVVLEARQARYEALQGSLLEASEQLAAQNEHLQGTMHLLLGYQRRSQAALTYIMGRSCSISDAIFYVSSGAGVLLLGAVPVRALQAQVPRLLLLLVCTLVTERWAVAWLPPLLAARGNAHPHHFMQQQHAPPGVVSIHVPTWLLSHAWGDGARTQSRPSPPPVPSADTTDVIRLDNPGAQSAPPAGGTTGTSVEVQIDIRMCVRWAAGLLAAVMMAVAVRLKRVRRARDDEFLQRVHATLACVQAAQEEQLAAAAQLLARLPPSEPLEDQGCAYGHDHGRAALGGNLGGTTGRAAGGAAGGSGGRGAGAGAAKGHGAQVQAQQQQLAPPMTVARRPGGGDRPALASPAGTAAPPPASPSPRAAPGAAAPQPLLLLASLPPPAGAHAVGAGSGCTGGGAAAATSSGASDRMDATGVADAEAESQGAHAGGGGGEGEAAPRKRKGARAQDDDGGADSSGAGGGGRRERKERRRHG